jgi:predicted O-methyltransferase YrrM
MRMKADTINFHSGLGDSANLLYGLVRSMKPEICVEIGSARGRSACYIGMALKENGSGKLYAIDPHTATNWNDIESSDSIDILRSNISALGLSNQIVIICSSSEEAGRNWNRPIDLIFIDGDHSYEGVKHDWELFSPHVKPFGIVLFHDTAWSLHPPTAEVPTARVAAYLKTLGVMGVPRFVDELRANGYQALTIDQDCGLTLIQPTVGGVSLVPKLNTASPNAA